MKLMEESQFRGTLLKKEEESGQTKSGEPSLDKSSSSFLLSRALVHFTPYMKFQREKNFSPQKFVEAFPEVIKSGPSDFIFFVSRRGKYGCFSNWFQQNSGYIGEDGIHFLTSEHHFVWLKAKLFGDKRTMSKVLTVQDPADVKKLGRKISPFDEGTWQEYRYRAMFSAVLTKFQNSPQLKRVLLDSKEAYIAEAAGYDFDYGLGLWEFSSEFIRGCKAKDGSFDILPEEWPGANMLGIALMEVRTILKELEPP